ncbi:M20 family metallopeptidase [Robertmurraya massiliosenegalensis]|uniref:M20 family metallopeptidase n=1 Tax=Robertmurraya TaxID=2837507 RepID=UPI0039A4E272
MNTKQSSFDLLTKEISNYIYLRQNEMLAFLKELVEVESPTESIEGVNRVGQILAKELEDLGFTITQIKEEKYGNHIIADYVVPEAPRVLMVGHMDTVFPVGTGWGFSLKENRAYGPGLIDMKSGDAVILYSLRALKNCMNEFPMSIRVFFNGDEEPGSPQSRKIIPKVVEGVDWAFVFEPSEPSGQIVLKRKGVGIFHIEVEGRSAHAGQEPEKGINAIHELAHQIKCLENLADPKKGTTISVGKISGGTAAYVVPDTARAVIDIRVPDTEEQYRIEKEMKKLEKNQSLPGSVITVKGGFHRPPMVERQETKVMKEALLQSAAKLEQTLQFGSSGAVSDGNNINAEKIPTIDGIGPIGGRAHSTDEYMEVESFFDRTVLMALTLGTLSREGRKSDE